MSREQDQPQINWDDPAAVEALLASEGLGDIDRLEQPQNTAAIVSHYVDATPATALQPNTVRETLARYQGDMIGGAIAAHFTTALGPELALDGSLDDHEIGIVDDITTQVQGLGLTGATVTQLTEVFGIDLNYGGLLGLTELRTALESVPGDTLDALKAELNIPALEEDDDEPFLTDMFDDDELEDDDSDDDSYEDPDLEEDGETFEF